MDEAMSHLEQSTLIRSQTTQKFVQRVFAAVCKRLTRVGNRTLEKYCQTNKIPLYIVKFFTPDEKQLIRFSSFDDFEVKLSYKFLKTCCGLKESKHASWSPTKYNKVPPEEQDTFEFLIAYCWHEFDQVLQNSSSLTDDDFNYHIDKTLEALILLLQKMEKKARVSEQRLKNEINSHIRKGPIDSYDHISSVQHKCVIFRDHLLHQILVLVYNRTNHLFGMLPSTYMKSYGLELIHPNEQKFLEGNPPPEKMHVRMLYQVVKRVCFLYCVPRIVGREPLLDTMQSMKEEYTTPIPNEVECDRIAYRFHINIKSIYVRLCERSSKQSNVIIRELAREALAVKPPIQKPFELPDSSQDKKSDLLEESPVSPTTPSFPLKGPSTSIKDGLSIEEVNVCVLFKVMRPGGLISQTLAQVFKALGGDLAKIQSNENTWKSSFTAEEKNLINKLNDDPASRDWELSQKDVAFLCKILRYGCKLSKYNSDWSISSDCKDTIEYNITVIRKERNKLAHEVTNFKTEDLCTTLNAVKISLHVILEKAKIFLNFSETAMRAQLQKLQSEMDNEIQKMSQISYDLSLNNEWKEFFDLKDKVKAAAQKELMQSCLYGESMQNMSPIIGSTDSRHKALTIEAVFMERHLEDKDDVNAGVRGTCKVEDILFNPPFRVCIIPGRPGDGKTSICKYLFHLWSQDIVASALKGVDLLFYIPCRYVTVKSLSEYLKGKLPKALGGIKNEDVVPLLQEPQVVFVIDGYDEAGEEAKGLINEILISLPDSKVIITTKTQWAPKLMTIVETVTFDFKVLRIVQMTDEMHKEYAKKFFSAMNQDREDCNCFLKYLDEMKESLDSLTDVSLTFSLLALLWIEEPVKAKKIRTLAELYYKMTDLIIKRVSKQLRKNDIFLFHDWIKNLGEIAWDSLKMKRYYLNEIDQDSLNRKAREQALGIEGYDHMMSSLLFCEIHDSLVADEKKKWTFTFTSQQEYLSAVYLVYEITQSKTTSLKNLLELSGKVNKKYKKKLQRLIPVMKFICGLLVIHEEITDSIKEITEIMSVIEPWSFNALESMFRYLTEDNAHVKDVVKMMFKNEKLSTYDNYDTQSTLWVLNNTSLNFQKEVTVLSNVNDVPQSVPLLRFFLSKRCEVKVVVDVDNVSNISELSKLIVDFKYDRIRFFVAPWKPLCISEVITAWTSDTTNTPLHFSLCPEVYSLVWWKLLMCLLAMNKKVRKLVCSPNDHKCLELVEEGAKMLKAEEVVKDYYLLPTEVVIYVFP